LATRTDHITICDTLGTERVEFEKLEVEEAREMVGAFIAMDGNQNARTQALWEKAIKWADQVHAGRSSHAEAWFSLQLCMMKSLEYPLMASSLSKEQCNKIVKLIRAAVLPVLGINRHLTLAIVHNGTNEWEYQTYGWSKVN
jgi:hypothetical protein